MSLLELSHELALCTCTASIHQGIQQQGPGTGTCEVDNGIAGSPANKTCTGPFSPGLGGVAVSLLVLRRELGSVHACLASLTSLLSAASGCASF